MTSRPPGTTPNDLCADAGTRIPRSLIDRIKCLECDGSGAAQPDCWVCKGQRAIKVRRAYALGWRKGDLENVEDDGYCDCPRYECRGDSCIFCDGDGTVLAIEARQQAWRVLYFAATQEIPPVFSRLHNGRIVAQDILLSLMAARRCRDKGLVTWFCSVFGDEIHLTPKGERLAMRLGITEAPGRSSSSPKDQTP